jgi:zinc protease
VKFNIRKLLVGTVMTLAFGLTSYGFSPVVTAQDTTTGVTAEQVLDGYVKAIGGAEKVGAFKTRVTKATLSMPQIGLNGPMTITQKAPNLYRMEMELPGVGKMIQVCDGQNVMDKNPLTGERMLSGAEKENVMLEATFNSELHWKKLYKTTSYEGREDIDGTPCHKVVVESASGTKRTMYYDAATGLLKKITAVMSTPQGEIATESTIDEYKVVDGVKYASKTTISALGQQQIIEVESIQHDVELGADAFAIPKS